MNVVIIQFPGTNCEYDALNAFKDLGAKVNIIWHKEEKLPANTHLVVLPGGFSYGDYLRCGAIASFAKIMKDIKKYASNGGKVLGICNGFQILCEAGLLPGALKRNDNLHFISRYQNLKVINNNNSFLSLMKKDEIVNIPIAHHDGNYYIDKKGLKELEENKQILLKYCDKEGNYSNINGSISQIAGICNKQRNIFGLMPHPERAIDKIFGTKDGKKMLEGFLQ